MKKSLKSKSKYYLLSKKANSKGITLIALIITIIVLLILAGVTINLTLGENGIFRTAEMAGKNYMDAQDKELAGLADFENTINNIIGGGSTEGEEKQQLVEEIILSNTEVTLGLNRTENLEITIKPENASNKNIIWESNDETIVKVENGVITGVNIGEAIITGEAADGSGVKVTCKVTVAIIPGAYVKYDTGISSVGENGIVTFRVLYNDDTYGLQIISDKNIEIVPLAQESTDEIIQETPLIKLSTWEQGRDSYNNAIAILNEKAEYYATSSMYALDGRCVGSVPTIGADGKFNAKNTENVGPVQLQFSSTVEGANSMKDADENYTTDQTAMQAVNIWTTGEYYWLASRRVNSYSSLCRFSVRFVDTSGGLDSYYLCYLGSDGHAYSRSIESGLRPCISLKSDIKVIAGDGTSEETAYELGI